MRQVAFGTAHLFGLVPVERSPQLLAAAWDAGVRRYDTAPSYGLGRSEEQLAAFLAGRAPGEQVTVTTKVGIAPLAGPQGARSLAKRAARLLPTGVQERLRGSVRASTQGRFGVDEVRSTVERSLSRLGRPVDRLLLHEVQPEDITAELVEHLQGLLDRGDVLDVGVATRNALTASALAAAPGLLTAVHVECGPLSTAVELPTTVTARVGHGLLGPGGEHLRRLSDRLAGDAQLADRWAKAVLGTPYEGPRGLGTALLSRPSPTLVEEVVVATGRLDAVGATVRAAGAAEPPPAEVTALLDRLVADERAAAP